MKYLGIDYGAKRVGIAISNEEGTIAFPRVEIQNNQQLLSSISRLIKEEGIKRLIVGDTRSHGGGENSVTAEAEKFIAALARTTSLPVERAFEAWSSIEASRYAPEGKGHSNAAAAAIILQRYLDMHDSKHQSSSTNLPNNFE
jgi:putative Holliday junction resolvase